MEKANPVVKKILIKAIKTQLKENNPPQVRQAYLRGCEKIETCLIFHEF